VKGFVLGLMQVWSMG